MDDVARATVNVNWIEAIDDPELDPEQIMAAVRRQMTRRNVTYSVAGLAYPAHPAARSSGKPEDIPYDLALHAFIERARALDNGTAMGGPAYTLAQIPLFGRVWVVFHRIASRALRPIVGQRAVNQALIGAVERLVAENQVQARQIVALRAELDALRQAQAERS